MAENKQEKKSKEGLQAAEPRVRYALQGGETEVRFFASFAEMNEADLEEMASASPEESLMHATLMIRQIYAAELKKKFSGYTIHFK